MFITKNSSEVMSRCNGTCCNFCQQSIKLKCCPQEIQNKSAQGPDQKEISNKKHEYLSLLNKSEPLPKSGTTKTIPGMCSKKNNQKNNVHNKITSSPQQSIQDGHGHFHSKFPQNKYTPPKLLQKSTSVCQHCMQYVSLQNYEPKNTYEAMCTQAFHPVPNYLPCVTIQPINCLSIFPCVPVNNCNFTSYYPKLYQATGLLQPQWQSMFCNGWYPMPMQCLQYNLSGKDQQYKETINNNETSQMNSLACYNQEINCKTITPNNKEKGFLNPENEEVNIEEYNIPEMDNVSNSSLPLFFDDTMSPYSTSESGIYEEMDCSNSPSWKTIDEGSDLEERQEVIATDDNQILNKRSTHIRNSSVKSRESDIKTNVQHANSPNLFIKSKICEENISLTHTNTQNAKFKLKTNGNLENQSPMETKCATRKGFKKIRNMGFSNEKLPLQKEDVLKKEEISNKIIEQPINKQNDLTEFKSTGNLENNQQTFQSDKKIGKNPRSTRIGSCQLRKHTPMLQIENKLMDENKMRNTSIRLNNPSTLEVTTNDKQLEKNDALENKIHNKRDLSFNSYGHGGDAETTDITNHAESQFSNLTGNRRNKNIQNKEKKSKNKKEANRG